MLARYRPTPDALFATLSDGAVVLDVQRKRCFSLNDTGARLWACVRDGMTDREMVAVLMAEYDVSAEEAGDAVRSLLQSLAAEQLIEPVPL